VIEEPKPRKIASYIPTTWQPWYVSISDWMIRNPGGDYTDCARDLGRHVVTIRYIVHSDIFQEFHSQRKAKWRESHDFAIVSRLTNVATKSLDLMIDKMEKQADKIPMNLITEIATASLDRLGYAPDPKQTSAVNVNIDNRQQTMQVPVTAAALEEARDALRAAEQKRGIEAHASAPLGPPSGALAPDGVEEIEQ
jgi:hypothetical protein